MLAELNVENVALIEKSRLSLGPGFNVLTGETGAGKSLVLDALGMVIGQRAGADLIRTGAQAARVEALFEVPASSGVAQALEAAGYPPEDGQLLLAREIHRSGRNRCRINGRPATVGELARLGALLVDVQTQHESQRLMLASVQLQLLDAFAGPDVLELAGRVADLWGRWSAARSELEQLRTRERERLHEIDLLRFQIQEIDAAALQPGEEEALMDEHSRLAHAVQLQQLLGEALEHLGAGASSRADVGALALSGMAQRLVQQAASLDRALEPIGRELLACTEQLGELARAMRRHLDQYEVRPDRLQEVVERLELIDRLKRKYGNSVRAVLEYADAARRKLEALESESSRAGQLQAAVEELGTRYEQAAAELSRRRQEAAQRLSRAVERELGELAMPRARFEVAVAPDQQPGPSGRDGVTFHFSANPGEALRPLARVASGGELSRTLLACQSVLAHVQEVPVLVFDEPDAGLGGRAAQAVGERLARLGRLRQVLVVTHLPQVASMADFHIRVEKVDRDGRSLVQVRPLSPGERIEELARMLGGSTITDSARVHAEELLRLAGQAKAAG